MNRANWSWDPDDATVEAIKRGDAKVRNALRPKQPKEKIMAKAKKTSAKAPKGKKLDGKKLAAERKPRDSVAQFIKDELLAGKTDVEKIVASAKKAYPKTKPTNGYVRWLAKSIGKEKAVARVPAEKKSKSVDPAS